MVFMNGFLQVAVSLGFYIWGTLLDLDLLDPKVAPSPRDSAEICLLLKLTYFLSGWLKQVQAFCLPLKWSNPKK